ncbi:MAG TPA: hypothetical protein VGL58_15640 [Caulobacteraceae bacterium]|jgi:hypothetical protein
MARLGRLLALPLMLLALALQGYAPAAAAAMPRDAFGQPICTAHPGAGGHQDAHAHDCCADACALAGLGAPPADPPVLTRSAASAEIIAWAPPAAPDFHTAARLPPRARGPPSSLRTL